MLVDAELPLPFSGGRLDGKLGPTLLPDVLPDETIALLEAVSGKSDGGSNRGGAMSARMLVHLDVVGGAVVVVVLGSVPLTPPTVLE